VIGTIAELRLTSWTQVRQERMFHFLAESIQAYNQAGLFFGALICLSIGGFFLGDAFYWRVHAIRASGTIIGVLAKDGVYTAVYRYAVRCKADNHTGQDQIPAPTRSGARRLGELQIDNCWLPAPQSDYGQRSSEKS
jgi:hypothetical protein